MTTMRHHYFILLIAGALALTGCSSTPTRVDTGPVAARTFRFVSLDPHTASFAEGRQKIHSLVQEAITKSLTARGLQRVATGGDVTVGYLLITGNNASTSSVNDYFSYSENAAALEDKAHEAYTDSKNPNYFEAGTLVVDLVDSKTFKLLKRGYATRPGFRNLPDDVKIARLQEVADEIFRDLRIQQ